MKEWVTSILLAALIVWIVCDVALGTQEADTLLAWRLIP
jgi:hypothetical protein